MRVVDTSAWIEWFSDRPLAPFIGTQLPKKADWLVPTIVQLELAKWLTRESGEAIADRVLSLTQTCVVVDLDTPIAFEAARLAAEHHLSTAGAVIYATALMWGADLLTCDAHLEGLPEVIYLDKSKR